MSTLSASFHRMLSSQHSVYLGASYAVTIMALFSGILFSSIRGRQLKQEQLGAEHKKYVSD